MGVIKEIFSNKVPLRNDSPFAPDLNGTAASLVEQSVEAAARASRYGSQIGTNAVMLAKGLGQVIGGGVVGSAYMTKDLADFAVNLVGYTTKLEWYEAISKQTKIPQTHRDNMIRELKAIPDEDFDLLIKGIRNINKSAPDLAKNIVKAAGNGFAAFGTAVAAGVVSAPEIAREAIEQTFGAMHDLFQFAHDKVSNDGTDSRGRHVEKGASAYGLTDDAFSIYKRAGESFQKSVDPTALKTFVKGLGNVLGGTALSARDATYVAALFATAHTFDNLLIAIEKARGKADKNAKADKTVTLARQLKAAHLESMYANRDQLKKDWEQMRKGADQIARGLGGMGGNVAEFAKGVAYTLVATGVISAAAMVYVADSLREYLLEAPLQAAANLFAVLHNAVANEEQGLAIAGSRASR